MCKTVFASIFSPFQERGNWVTGVGWTVPVATCAFTPPERRQLTVCAEVLYRAQNLGRLVRTWLRYHARLGVRAADSPSGSFRTGRVDTSQKLTNARPKTPVAPTEP